jgi:hypothetical protein
MTTKPREVPMTDRGKDNGSGGKASR